MEPRYLGHVRLSLAKKLKELKGVEERGLYRSDPTHVHQLLVDIQALMSKEETMWKQRSHVEWLKEGDQNTRYFHCRANQRNKRSYILGFEDEFGDWIEEEGRIGEMVVEYFANIFTT